MRLSLTVLMVLSVLTATAEPSGRELLGTPAPSFRLKDSQGFEVALDSLKEKKAVVVIFLGTECPMARLYGPKLGELATLYGSKGVAFLGIDSNQQDSLPEIAHFEKMYRLTFPLLKDVGNVVADQWGASRTPEAYVLDADRVVRYHGRIDDQFGVGHMRARTFQHDMRNALDQVLAGQPVSKPRTEATGCLIGRVKPIQEGSVTFAKQISRIFQKHCQECHRPNTVAPFSLLAHEDAVGWAEMIGEVVADGRMPPWHADPKHGRFSNESRLSDEEKALIAQWVKDGGPMGDPKDLPAPITFTDGWRIPKPDVVLTMPKAVSVPARGVMGYQHIVVDTGFKEDKWVKFAEARAGDAAVVHHIIVFVHPPSGRDTGHGGLGGRFLVATAPGARPLTMPDGMAKLIPAGSKLVFQMHYTPNGRATTDQSSVGLVFADPKSIKRQVYTEDPGQFAFRIPPHESNYKMVATHFFREPSIIVTLFPHMHVRGKSFRFDLTYPDGRQETLLDVPRYDFAWQNTYVLAEPLKVPAGSKLTCTAHYDNSADNLSNPNPDVSVTWGEQTWEEMMFGFFDMARDEEINSNRSSESRTQRFIAITKGGVKGLDTNLQSLAERAAQSPTDFERFGNQIQSLLPQVDRVCLAVLDNETMETVYAEQDDRVRTKWSMRGDRRSINGLSLPKYAAGKDLVRHQRLAGVKGFDLALMAKTFKSSAHAPMTYQGKPAVLSFWSLEESAFPDAATPLLRELTRAVESNAATQQASLSK